MGFVSALWAGWGGSTSYPQVDVRMQYKRDRNSSQLWNQRKGRGVVVGDVPDAHIQTKSGLLFGLAPVRVRMR